MSLRSVRSAKSKQQQHPLEPFEQTDGLPSWVFSRAFLLPAALVLAILTIIISREANSFFKAQQPQLPKHVSCFMPRALYLPGLERLNHNRHFGKESQTRNSYRRNSSRAFSAIRSCPAGNCSRKRAKKLAIKIAKYVKKRSASTVMFDKDYGDAGVAGINKLYRTSQDYLIRNQFKEHLRKGSIKMSDFRGRNRQLVWAWTKLPPDKFNPCRPS